VVCTVGAVVGCGCCRRVVLCAVLRHHCPSPATSCQVAVFFTVAISVTWQYLKVIACGFVQADLCNGRCYGQSSVPLCRHTGEGQTCTRVVPTRFPLFRLSCIAQDHAECVALSSLCSSEARAVQTLSAHFCKQVSHSVIDIRLIVKK
jgi:hypothetical protein